MDLGQFASYRLPAGIRSAFGVETAQQLADQLGAKGTLSPQTAQEAEAAYNAYKKGDRAAAHAFLTGRLGLTDAVADDALNKLSKA
ncbi:hypothetical protein [Herbiconiux daphne]|uniref:Uncharacterized protein n=1 Tax=Herbiconiux daphne TaxID=2970914 RepID=A0ABT2H5P5_9MICO|nr:hypothetical protein [Herbiconiux daphne]MCS5735257.1 hypothetical protein [Herbiconiux daphne]